MEYRIYMVDITGKAHFLQKATDDKHANICCDRYFDELWIHDGLTVHSECEFYSRAVIANIFMVRSDQDPYEGVMEV